MRRLRIGHLAVLLLASAFAGACASSQTSDLTAEVASDQVHTYLEQRTAWAEALGMPVLFSDYFEVLAVEVLETSIEGDEARVRCDIALAPVEPIPAETLEAGFFTNIVGSGPKPGPLIVTHTFVFRQYEGYWLLETMND